MFPALPTGSACMSGAVPSASTISVDRVDQRDCREVGGHLAGQFQAIVEIAVDLDDLGAVHNRLRQLAHRDLALRYQHRAGDTRAGGICGRRRRGVSRRCTQHGVLAAGQRVGDRHRHAPVLEGAGGVEALDLEMDGAAGPFGEPGRRDQRGTALEQGDGGPVVADRQPVAVRRDHSRPGLMGGRPGSAHRPFPSNRSTLVTLCTTSRSASAWTVSDSAASVAVCVTTTTRAPTRRPSSSTMPS
jgi:hypothetical protein